MEIFPKTFLVFRGLGEGCGISGRAEGEAAHFVSGSRGCLRETLIGELEFRFPLLFLLFCCRCFSLLNHEDLVYCFIYFCVYEIVCSLSFIDHFYSDLDRKGEW